MTFEETQNFIEHIENKDNEKSQNSSENTIWDGFINGALNIAKFGGNVADGFKDVATEGFNLFGNVIDNTAAGITWTIDAAVGGATSVIANVAEVGAWTIDATVGGATSIITTVAEVGAWAKEAAVSSATSVITTIAEVGAWTIDAAISVATSELVSEVVGSLGKLDESLKLFSSLGKDEQRIVTQLLNEGKNVKLIPETPNIGKMYDFLVDCVPTELKTLNGNNINTLVTKVGNALKQIDSYGQIIYDISKAGFTSEQMAEINARLVGKYGEQILNIIRFIN